MEWLRTWLGRARNRIAVVAGLAAIAVVGALSFVAASNSGSSPAPGPPSTLPSVTTKAVPPGPTPVDSPSPTPTVFAHFGILDGVGMTDEEWEARKDLLPLAVMFDNSEQAFPHAGLGSADVIYEAFVEGGITRLMAVYWRREAEFVEPVRSARTPFVVWAVELGALFAHAGGPTTENEADAIGQIARWGVRDLNAFGPIADEFYRDPSREGPHDLATSTASLREGGVRMGFAGPPTFEPWLFRDAPAETAVGEPAEGIEIDFGGRRSQWQLMQYRWDAATRSYGRFQYGGPHLDARTKEQLRFTTVIAMRVPFQVVDDAGHVVIDQTGSGKATIFTDGLAIEATWKKADRAGRTRFFDANGAEIQFARGPIFIEVIGPASSVVVKARAADLPDLPPYVAPPPFVPTPEPDETPATTPTSSSTPPTTQSPTARAGTQTPAPTTSALPSAKPSASPVTPAVQPTASPTHP